MLKPKPIYISKNISVDLVRPGISLSLIIDPLRHLHRDPVQRLGHAHLTAQPGGVRQTEGQVQHVQLFVCRLLVYLVKGLR